MLKIMAMIIRKRNLDIIDDRENDKKCESCDTCKYLERTNVQGSWGLDKPWYSCAICYPDFMGSSYVPELRCKYYSPNKNYKAYLKRRRKRPVIEE